MSRVYKKSEPPLITYRPRVVPIILAEVTAIALAALSCYLALSFFQIIPPKYAMIGSSYPLTIASSGSTLALGLLVGIAAPFSFQDRLMRVDKNWFLKVRIEDNETDLKQLASEIRDPLAPIRSFFSETAPYTGSIPPRLRDLAEILPEGALFRRLIFAKELSENEIGSMAEQLTCAQINELLKLGWDLNLQRWPKKALIGFVADIGASSKPISNVIVHLSLNEMTAALKNSDEKKKLKDVSRKFKINGETLLVFKFRAPVLLVACALKLRNEQNRDEQIEKISKDAGLDEYAKFLKSAPPIEEVLGSDRAVYLDRIRLDPELKKMIGYYGHETAYAKNSRSTLQVPTILKKGHDKFGDSLLSKLTEIGVDSRWVKALKDDFFYNCC